jgi:hypothetical protein
MQVTREQFEILVLLFEDQLAPIELVESEVPR